MKNFVFFFFIFFLQFASSQDVDPGSKYTISQNYIYLAELEFVNNNFARANDYFSKAFLYHEAMDSYQLLDAAACALQVNDEYLFEKYVTESIVFFKAPLDFILEYDKFIHYKNNNFLKSLPNNYDKLLNQYYARQDNLLAYIEAATLADSDQIIRNVINEFDSEINLSGLKTDKDIFIKISNKILNNKDEETAQKLINLTKKHGFQKSSWIILWHHRITFNDKNDRFWQYFKPVIADEIKKGKLHKSYLATFTDVNETIWNQNQTYGTLPQYPIANVKDVDVLRETVGLPPLLYDHIVYGKVLPDSYTLSEKELKEVLLRRIDEHEK